MFNACRRGPASITRILSAAGPSIRIPSTKASSLSLSFRSVSKPVLETRWLHISARLRAPPAAAEAYKETTEQIEYEPITKFQELLDRDLVHPNVVSTILQGMGHTTMTEVQSQTINQALTGVDM